MSLVLPKQIEQQIEALDQDQQALLIETIEAFLARETSEKPRQIPSWVGIGASGRGDLSHRTKELLFTDYSPKRSQ